VVALGSQALGGIDAEEPRHHVVEDDDVGMERPPTLQTLLA
jgi:hypothetical protein